MSKITKQDLQSQINGLYATDSTRHNKMLRMQRALSSIGVDIMSDEFDAPDSAPKLKTLDQSVFDGQDEKWQFAAVDMDGSVWVYHEQPKIDKGADRWSPENTPPKRNGICYDASDWQNSLIGRESKELTGSNLAVAYFKAGGKPHICYVGDDGDENTNDLNIELITRFCTIGGFISSRYDASANALLIDSNGNELTAKDVGL